MKNPSAHEVFITKATGRRDVVFEQNCEAGAYHIIQISLGSQDLERVGQYSCVVSFALFSLSLIYIFVLKV